MSWIFLVLLYGLLKGGREICKKLAMGKNSVMEVLVTYTVLSFILVIPQAPQAGGLELKYYFFIALKSFCIFVAWICGFRSLKKLPVSLYGILDLSRVLFATFCGIAFLEERLSLLQGIGLIIVCAGLLLLKFRPPFLKKLCRWEEDGGTAPLGSNAADSTNGAAPTEPADSENAAAPTEPNSPSTNGASHVRSGTGTAAFFHSSTFYVILALLSCILNAVSGFMDKVLMKDITSSQLQFWYMLFLVLYYLVYILVTREKIHLNVLKNQWIWILAVMFVIGDKALFIANGNPASKITVMTLIKQSGCLITILGGRLIFKEKNTLYRLLCALIIIAGIVIGVQ